jgi:hypothetical protein
MSGPVVIPKVYIGKNRTFFMYGYEGIWSFDPSPWVVESVPTQAMRRGDFSALLALGSRYQIYDPFSTVPAAGGLFTRQPVPGNIIPANRINPVSANIAKLWDEPNQPGTVDGINNYTKGKNAQDTYWNHIVRIDHNISEKQRLYFRTNFTDLQRPENIRHNLAVGDNFFRYNKGFAVDDVYTISPRHFVNTRYTLTRFITGNDVYQQDFDLAGLGFSLHQPDQRGRSPLLQAAEHECERLFEPGRRGVAEQRGNRHPRVRGQLHVDGRRARSAVRLRVSDLPAEQR